MKIDYDKQKELAVRICQEIDLAEEGKGDLKARWRKHEELFQNQMQAARNDLPDASNLPIPLMEPKISQLIANTVGGMTSALPYFIARSYGEGSVRNDAQENAIHFAFKKANWEYYARKAGKHAALTGQGIYRITFKDGETEYAGSTPLVTKIVDKLKSLFGVPGIGIPNATNKSAVGISFDVIHPENFIVYPTTVVDLECAKMTGHRFYRRLKEVQENGKRDYYIKEAVEKVAGGDDVLGSGFDRVHSKGANNEGYIAPEDAQVECYQVIYKADLEGTGYERLYWVTVAKTAQELLKIEEYDYSRTCYFDVSFDQDIADNGYWKPNCPAYNIQGLHLAHSYLINDFIDAAEMSIWPPVFAAEMGGPEGKTIRYKKGEVIEVDPMMQPTTFRDRVDLSSYPILIEMIRGVADESIRISRLGSGGQLRSGATATEASLLAGGQEVGVTEYFSNFAMGHVPMVEFACELLTVNFTKMKAQYGDAWPAETPIDLVRHAEWEVNGKTPAKSPQAVLNSALLLKEMALDPEFGFDKWEIGRAVKESSSLDNNDKLQMPKEQLMQLRAAAVQEADGMMRSADEEAFNQEEQMNDPSQMGGVPPDGGMGSPDSSFGAAAQ